jgi:hypothetical protein
MSSTATSQKILIVLTQYCDLLKQLLGEPLILRGSFHQVHTRCGKATCWCATAPQGHAHLRLTWSEAGQLMTRKVPEAEAQTVRQLTKNFRIFKKQRRRLVSLGNQIENHLNQYEKARIQEVRKPLTFLAIRQPLSGKNKKRLQKEPERKKGLN